MPGRRSPWCRPRPSPAASSPWRCSPSISAGCAIFPPPTARGCSRRCDALPDRVAAILEREDEIARLADFFQGAEHAFYVGRAAGHAIAMEGALKLKEISYLHAEAYPASELKHGPLALVTPQTPTVIVLPRDDLFAKNVSTIEEVKARGGPVLAITHPGEAACPVRPLVRGAGARARARSPAAVHSAAASRLSRRAAARDATSTSRAISRNPSRSSKLAAKVRHSFAR